MTLTNHFNRKRKNNQVTIINQVIFPVTIQAFAD
jgi:hypothetical protein